MKGWQVGIEIAVGRRLVVPADALFINAVFCDRKMRCEVGRDKVLSGCGLNKMSLDDDKWDHMMRLSGHDITIAPLLGASSVECVTHQRYLVFVLWTG